MTGGPRHWGEEGDRLHLIVPGALDQRTGGYLYDARVAEGLEARGWEVRVHELEGRFPPPADGARAAAAALDAALASCADGATVVVDGLALGGVPEVAGRHGARLRLIALVHHPLAEETGLGSGERERLRAREARALAACHGVVVTSGFTAERVVEMGVDRDAVRAVPPGTAPAPPARGPGAGEPPRLLCVATVVPRKGHDVLVEALTELADRRWRCLCVGSLDRDPAWAAAVRERVREAGLEARIRFVGEKGAEALDALYDGASLFVLPSRYEGYGMALTEALARGLPVVSTTGGAIPHTVPADAGVLVPPGDAEALTAALADLLDPVGGAARLHRLSQAALRRGRELPTWADTVDGFERALRELVGRDGGTPMTDATASATSDTFAAEWLALREPVDHRSRARELVAPLREAWASRGGSRIVDLGSGTGSNLRWLGPRLPGAQRWTLVDRDRALLEGVASAGGGEVVEVERVHGDLGREGLAAAANADLVTASALLDLVGVGWMEEWVDVCRRARAMAYVALTYDGTVRWEAEGDGPEDRNAVATNVDGARAPDEEDANDRQAREGERALEREDARIAAAVNAHQRRDKGTGRALGPEAARTAETLFRAAGYRTRLAPSPWRLGPEDAALAEALVDGWADAAREVLPTEGGRVDAWVERRRATIASGDFALVVGHLDLLALPPRRDGRPA